MTVGVDWVLLSPSSVSVTVETPNLLTEIGLAEAPGAGASDAAGAQATAPVGATAKAAAAVTSRRLRAGLRPCRSTACIVIPPGIPRGVGALRANLRVTKEISIGLLWFVNDSAWCTSQERRGHGLR